MSNISYHKPQNKSDIRKTANDRTVIDSTETEVIKQEALAISKNTRNTFMVSNRHGQISNQGLKPRDQNGRNLPISKPKMNNLGIPKLNL